jgi:biopolymer transport protein ExbD
MTNVLIYVQIKGDRTCAVGDTSVPCEDVGKAIRAAHLSDNPIISICLAKTATYDVVGRALKSLSDEHFPRLTIGCFSETR